MNTAKPLEGIVVLDLTIALSGPYASLLLAGLGARVIKVENPRGGDPARENAPYLGPGGVSLGRTSPEDVSLAALSRMRGKESICIDLKSPAGKAVFLDLVKKADIVIQNFSAGIMDGLGLGWETLHVANPRLIFTSISGFGQGPDGAGKAMDSIIQSLSGTMLASGSDGEPPVRVGFPVADLAAPLFAVIGTLSALLKSRATGEGEHVDVSMLGALTSLVAVEPWAALEELGVPLRTGTSMPRLAPFGTYRTADGWLSLCAPLDAFARGLYAALEQPELESDPLFSTRDARVRNARTLDAIIESWSSELQTTEAISILERHGVPVAPVLTPGEAILQPRVTRRNETVPIGTSLATEGKTYMGPGLPIVFSDRTTDLGEQVPGLGQHTADVLIDLLGISTEAVDDLVNSGAVSAARVGAKA